MRINNLELTDFRNYNHFFIEFDQGINILIGGNAQGKTNIIEAIYLLSVCKSFRTHINDQMIQFDHDFAKVKGNVFSNERMHQLELILSSYQQEIGSVEENLASSFYKGEPLTISFSCKYASDAIKSFSDDKIKILFTGEMKPFIVKDFDSDELLQLVLPVRTY